MTCFWDGLINALNGKKSGGIPIFVKFMGYPNHVRPTPTNFIQFLKNKNIKTTDVLWNNKYLTERELDEGFQSIKELDINTIRKGYFCSSCDPFLLLISQVFQVNINHKLCGNLIEYKYKYSTSDTLTLEVGSNTSHFWTR